MHGLFYDHAHSLLFLVLSRFDFVFLLLFRLGWLSDFDGDLDVVDVWNEGADMMFIQNKDTKRFGFLSDSRNVDSLILIGGVSGGILLMWVVVEILYLFFH